MHVSKRGLLALIVGGILTVLLVRPAIGMLPVASEPVGAAMVPSASGATCAGQADTTTTGAAKVLLAPSNLVAASPANSPYNAAKNVITVPKGTSTTLKALSQAVGRPEALKELAPGEWLLGARIEIEQGGALSIAIPEVRWLKLRSDSKDFVSIKALGGTLEFRGVCVTSWSLKNGTYDENYRDGRSFVLARDGAQMTISDSELSYLGYDADESYGLAWRMQGTGGAITNSRLGNNFYGLYTYAVSNLVIRNNQVHHSVRYGIDPHTRSNHLLIEGNSAYDNGKHGIILAEGCSDSVIRNNTVYNNAMHGINIYQNSNNNLVEGNTAYGNGYEGIDVNDASGNTIKNNIVYDNAKAGIGIGQGARQNLVVGNTARSNPVDGIAVYSKASGTTIQANVVHNNGDHGISITSQGNTLADGNQVFENSVGVYLAVQPSTEVSREANKIYNNRRADVLGK